MVEPGDILVDCTGTRSLLRDLLCRAMSRTARPEHDGFRLEYALVVTFLYDQHYDCNEYCKYYKNVENTEYKFIPAVHRTFYDGSISHVTGIITISQEEFEAMPPPFDGAWLRDNFPSVAASMDRFIDKVREETHGEVVGELEIVRIPLDVYHARNVTSRRWHRSGVDHPLATDAGLPARGLGDRLAVFPVDLVRPRVRVLPGRPYRQPRRCRSTEMFDRYEAFMYRQWLRVYMRTQTIQHNKDLLASVDDTMGLLAKLHVY